MEKAGCDQNVSREDLQKTTGTVRQKVERTREKWADVESRIRQRMRIFPQKVRGMISSRTRREREIDESDLRLPTGGSQPWSRPEMDQAPPKPIVSIRERDAEENESEHPLAS